MSENLHGHAIHFLERLPRADAESAELALELYHEPKILRWVLSRVRIPENRERLAVSLAPDDVGPFLVSTREGAFVTCLGRDMATTDLHLVPHGQLLAHRRDWYEARDKLRLQDEIRRQDSRFDDFVMGLVHKGSRVSREEFVAASALQPVLKAEHLMYFARFADWMAFEETRLMRHKALAKLPDDALRRYWEHHWALSHFALLTALDGRRGLNDEAVQIVSDGAFFLFRFGEIGMFARGLWILARLGRTALLVCKKRLAEASTTMDWVGAAFGLATIGLRHDKLRAEVLELLESPPEYVGGHEYIGDFIRSVGRPILNLVRFTVGNADTMDAVLVGHGRGYIAGMSQGNLLDPPCRFEDENEVPEDLARAAIATASHDLRREDELNIQILTTLPPWISRCEAAELYPPRCWYDAFHYRWSRGESIRLLENSHRYWGDRMPVTAPRAPGRNDPCPCGSGKKFKKCCLGANA